MNQLFYQLQRTEERAARNNFNHASAALELASINKRLAEIDAQHTPLSRLQKSDRGEAYAVAFYCVIGRWPTGYEYLGDESCT